MLTDPIDAEWAHLWAGYADGLAAVAARLSTADPAAAGRWAERLDTLLAGLRGCGVEVLPRGWSFAAPPHADQLRGDDGTELIPVYRPDQPAGGVVRVKAFGVCIDGVVIRPAAVVVSAGPAPVGLAELEDVVRESLDPVAGVLRDRLRDWRTASLEGRLEAAAVELFVEFWDQLRGEWADPDAAAAFGDRLAVVLAEEFGLTPFYPGSFRDRPDGWVQAVGGGRMATGRVREVVRPGLTDRAGELRVPARVVVE
jgi:hypothetical protein